MYSLIITVRSIDALYTTTLASIGQYCSDVEVTLDHGEGYIIPSLIWPPPMLIETAEKLFWEVA